MSLAVFPTTASCHSGSLQVLVCFSKQYCNYSNCIESPLFGITICLRGSLKSCASFTHSTSMTIQLNRAVVFLPLMYFLLKVCMCHGLSLILKISNRLKFVSTAMKHDLLLAIVSGKWRKRHPFILESISLDNWIKIEHVSE